MTLANYDTLPFKKALSNTKYIPLPEITRTDADVALISIGFGLVQYAPITDPLFQATTRFNGTKSVTPIYLHNAPSGTMGCAVQASTHSPHPESRPQTNTKPVPNVHQPSRPSRRMHIPRTHERRCLALRTPRRNRRPKARVASHQPFCMGLRLWQLRQAQCELYCQSWTRQRPSGRSVEERGY